MDKEQEFVGLLNNEMDSLVDDYAKRRIADLEAKLAVADDRADRYWKQLGVVENENKQLKQQLAEMTEKYNACQEARKLENEFSQQDKKELRQQLAEKDKIIETQNNGIGYWKSVAEKRPDFDYVV